MYVLEGPQVGIHSMCFTRVTNTSYLDMITLAIKFAINGAMLWSWARELPFSGFLHQLPNVAKVAPSLSSRQNQAFLRLSLEHAAI